MKKFFIVILIITAAIVVIWKVNYPSGIWRYKITVEIETPEGIKSGSSVRELLFVTEPKIFPEQAGFGFYPRGEAVVVDMGPRGVLFVLSANELHDALPNPYYKKGRVEKYQEYIGYYDKLNVAEPAVLPQEKWPQMVTFEDIKDPKSVKLVWGSQFNKETQKYEAVNDFKTVFGAGVKLRRIMVEKTHESITWKVLDKYLSMDFWQKYKNWMYSLDISERGIYLHLFEFKQGENR